MEYYEGQEVPFFKNSVFFPKTFSVCSSMCSSPFPVYTAVLTGNLLLLGGILGQNLKNRSRRSNSVRTSLDPEWPAEFIYAIARSYRQVILCVN